MSSKTVYSCDHCGAECSGDEWASIGRWDEPKVITFGMTIHGCSKEHLGFALAKLFGIGVDGKADELLNRNSRELAKLTDANVFLAQENEALQQRIDDLQAHTNRVEAISESNLVPPGRTLVEGIGELVRLHRHAAKKIAELEKRIVQPMTADGKTPGQVDYEGYFSETFEDVTAWPSLSPVKRNKHERAAQAVLRAFGQPSQTTQDAAEALRRVRDRVSNEIHYEHKCLILDIVDDELAKRENGQVMSESRRLR